MTSSDDEHKWYKEEYLHPSSEHGSDGEQYEVLPSQKDEMTRQYRRRQSREEREAESPDRAPRSSALASEVKTARLYTPRGPLDSATDSQAYVSDMFHAAGMSIHTQSETPHEEQVRVKVEAGLESDVPSLPSDVQQLQQLVLELRQELATAKERLHEESGRFFTLLEQANEDRDKYREAARNWEARADNLVPLLQQAQEKIKAALEEVESGL